MHILGLRFHKLNTEEFCELSWVCKVLCLYNLKFHSLSDISFTRPESGACILYSEVLQHDICFHSRHWHTEALFLLILVTPPDFAHQSRPTFNAILTDRIILPLSAASSLQPYTHASMLITNLLNVINTQHMHPKNCTSILLQWNNTMWKTALEIWANYPLNSWTVEIVWG